MFAAVAFAFAMFYLHQLKNQIDNIITLQYLFYFELVSTPIIMLFKTEDVIPYKDIDLFYWLMLMLIVITTFSGQLFLAKAVFLKKGTYITPISYLQVTLTVIADIILFDE